ncbi:hypothetical protein COY16_01310 [Candidatus Roizmanbacteria bacterium CG_4_10_14_0_2_um_filter_39_13]|uniref:DUF1573 domain-containing protein n=1 Tax=Candidatus Roizmanbacteria bacterium CG_4_10_14_0_2_um_filter_39_13 TaxID=1974825 RepID=A0A2M7U0X1_9BACT|nr:MAG: hypothetical protein COY16_01310 [Candidatus Roizmanbacteria bacterium CG_4_10_14_0_2_um_filter_39_13]
MNIKLIVGFIIGIVILIGGSYALLNVSDTTSKIEMSENVKVATGVTDHDWGTIGINDGKVNATYTITNEGTEPMKLFNIETSCMCTTAQVKVGDNTSPEFGMQSNSQYTATLPPGETAEVIAVFDPAFHGPSGVGTITRQIMVETNDKSNPQLVFTAEAEVVSEVNN